MRFSRVLLRPSAALDPYQILSVPRSANTSEIKAAYYNLVKRHHPDLTESASSTASKAKSKNLDFKDIVAAYELLKDKRRREAYLRYGMGWDDGTAGTSSAKPDVGFSYENMHNPWGNRPRYRHPHERPRYPSSTWDYGHSDAKDFYSSNQNSEERTYTSNMHFASILTGLAILLYSVQFWRLAPPLPRSSYDESSYQKNAFALNHLVSSDPKDAPIWKQAGMILKGRDRQHEEASKALGAAREGAQKWGSLRRDGIRRRVRESTLEAVESGKIDTGHGLNPAPDTLPPEDWYMRQSSQSPSSSSSGDGFLLGRRERQPHQFPSMNQKPAPSAAYYATLSSSGEESSQTLALPAPGQRDQPQSRSHP